MLRLRNAHEAEEAVQECLLAALDAKHAFAGRSSERTWLIGILKNKIVDRFRRRSALEPVGEAISRKIFDQNGLWRSAPRKWQGDPEEAAQDAEFGAVLHECLRKLPHALRDVTILRELDNIGSGEIADMLDTSQANVWQRLHRARLALRACLEANWFNPPKQARTKRT